MCWGLWRPTVGLDTRVAPITVVGFVLGMPEGRMVGLTEGVVVGCDEGACVGTCMSVEDDGGGFSLSQRRSIDLGSKQSAFKHASSTTYILPLWDSCLACPKEVWSG